MAAHDDKISTNRRRLFKALSSVPVVMTLRPGSALANSSAYQCAMNIANPNTTPNLDQPGPIVTDGFVHATLKHWAISDGQQRYYADGNPVPCNHPAGLSFIVQVNGVYYDNLTPGVASTVQFKFSTSNPDTMKLKNANNEVCMTIVGKDGNFAMLGAVSADGKEFEALGFYPQKDPAVYDGLTTTCMNSLDGAGKFLGLTSG